MGKRENKSKKSHVGKIIIIFILLFIMCLGSFFGYSVYKNGGGLQGILATVLGQDIEQLEDLEEINILVLRNK